VLKWSVERLDGQAAAMPSAIGNLPTRESFDVSGMDLDHRRRQRPLTIDLRRMGSRGSAHQGSATFGAHLPAPLWDVHHALLDRLAQDRADAIRIQPRAGPFVR
jgi:phosphoenolpyruvate carboxykinase (GTP)